MGCTSLGHGGVTSFAAQCRRMRSLSLGGASGLWRESSCLLRFTNLTELQLSRRSLLGDADFVAVVAGLQGLRSLSLSACYSLTDAALATVPQTLEVLSLTCCDAIEGCSIGRFKRLRELRINGCPNIGVSAVQGIAVACTRLVRLVLPPHIPSDCIPIQGLGGHLHGLKLERSCV